MSAPRDPVALRFAALQLVRLTGAVLVLLGALMTSGRVEWLQALPPIAGYALAAIGLGTFFGLPAILAKRWKSKP